MYTKKLTKLELILLEFNKSKNFKLFGDVKSITKKIRVNIF